MLAEKAAVKTITKNDRTEMLLKYLSGKTVVQNLRSEMLAEKASEKTITKNDRTEMLPEN